MTSEGPKVSPEEEDLISNLEKANMIIESAARAKKALVRSGRFETYVDRTDGDLLNLFSADPIYSEFLKLARLEVGNFEDDYLYQRRLAGALFEQLALVQLASRQDLGGVVISGTDVVDAISALSPDRKIIQHGFGQVGIEGKYVPDGLVVGKIDGRSTVKGLVEVSLGKWSEKENGAGQVNGYHHLLHELGLNGGPKSSRPRLIVVTPDFDSPDNGYEWVRHEVVPVQKREFLNGLFDYAYYQDRRIDGVTLNQARQNFRSGNPVVANLASV